MISKILANRYEILQKIGTGGMGDVYKSHDRRLDRIVAIKTLKAEYNTDNNFIRKFKRESLAAASISHPNIVSIYDVGTEEINDEKIHYIVMEYIDGKTLKEKITEEGKLSEKTALNYTVQIAEALKVAHSKGIVHRDIKSQNIMITKDDRVKVTDFGIARVADNSTVTATNAIMGSVHYFSPEQARGSKVDNRSDIYSLGIVLYEMLTGELPFDADNPVSVALMQVQSNMPLPSSKNPQVSQYSDQIVCKMTMKDPSDRYADVYLLIRDIKNIQMGRTSNINYRSEMQNNSPISTTGIRTAPMLDRKNMKKEDEPRYIKNRPEKKKSSPLPVLLGIVTAILLAVMLFFVVPKLLNNIGNKDKEEPTKLVSVPTLVGKTQDEAKSELEKYGLVMEADFTENYDKTNREILEQDPAQGTQVEEGSSVKVVVNVIADVVEIPDLVGKTLEESQKIAAEAGITISNIELEYSKEYPEDQVIRQEPAAGTEVANNKNITVYVSKGEEAPIVIPNLRGINYKDAKASLEKTGFVVKVEEVKSNEVSKGDVVNFEPKDQAPRGSEITLYVSTGPLESDEEEMPRNEKPDESSESNENENLPDSLSVNMPNDGENHQVTIWRYTAKGNKHKIYDWNKSSAEGNINVPLEYVSKGDVFEIYIDSQKVESKKIN
ncbi:Stk1 family PASTA domain-containing Ser/Thr kinase [Peptoniphilus catoniae]|uniref:Stk1 family PASTA domain-containing Ser/Thr kinase n=1 Tax=Peptoniphilus catoniae TaxID=1660341 RepID=UPI0010FDF9DC|nr:Stk1 family PASTA domain-containing Ser/Thr kinase [Peptoniphilus catoniae]